MCKSWKGQTVFAQSHAWRKPKNDKSDSGFWQKWPTAYLQGKLSHCKFHVRVATRPFLAGGSLSTAGILLIDVSVLGLLLDRGISMGRRNHLTPGFLCVQVRLGATGISTPELPVFFLLDWRTFSEYCLFTGEYRTEYCLFTSEYCLFQVNIVYFQVNIELNIVCLQVNIGCLYVNSVCLYVNIVCLQVNIFCLQLNIGCLYVNSVCLYLNIVCLQVNI